jgi:flagellar L-ring protein precursor FlgH
MADRLSAVGEAPPVSPIENPNQRPDYKPVSMPMPAPQVAESNANSLWRSGARAFFKDQRAARVGDILTVLIAIDDKAEIDNTSTRTRNGADSMGVPNLLGLEAEYGSLLPDAVSPSSLLSTTTTSNNTGKGSIDRSEKIQLQVAAVINQILPNGNLVVNGSQEVRVNNEVRVLQLSGIIRPEDVTSANNISYEKIAEARISYGGRGQITDVQQPRYGSQILDIVSPF